MINVSGQKSNPLKQAIAFISGKENVCNGNLAKLKMALPKGRLFDKVNELLNDCGLVITENGRSYRPNINDSQIEVKSLKPQNIPKLVELGSQDIAFTGYDWIVEENAQVVELLDLGFNPVTLVAAISSGVELSNFNAKKLRVVSEYENISKKFLEETGLDYIFVKSFGATEAFMPEDADMMIDNTATGKTLKDNNLTIVKEILNSSTRLIASREALEDPFKKKKIETLLLIIKSVLEARKRVFIEMNVPAESLEKLLKFIPSMKSPTISKLDKGQGFAVKIAVMKSQVNELILKLKENGAGDILIFNPEKVVL